MAVVKVNLLSAEKVSAESRFTSRYAGGRPNRAKKSRKLL